MKLLRLLNSELNSLFLFELSDGNRVESVFYRGDTLCLSTQVGCAIGCPFCMSGSLGLVRNLTTQEIIGQYELLRHSLPIRRVAFAGIGEPLMNWESVQKAFWYFKKIGLGVSFYTTGFPVRNLRLLLNLPHSGLTLSLHSLRKESRLALLPHGGDLDELLRTLSDGLSMLSRRRRKKVSLAYLLLRGVNDTDHELEELGRLARRLGVGVTLLRYNPTMADYEDVGDAAYERAFLLLRSLGVRVTLSTRFRKDRLGGCGTLVVNRSVTAC